MILIIVSYLSAKLNCFIVWRESHDRFFFDYYHKKYVTQGHNYFRTQFETSLSDYVDGTNILLINEVRTVVVLWCRAWYITTSHTSIRTYIRYYSTILQLSWNFEETGPRTQNPDQYFEKSIEPQHATSSMLSISNITYNEIADQAIISSEAECMPSVPYIFVVW